jgi:prepilin-type N-terminal cleavage/methylation domain-containing protein/prepilin-type processing-associated H-X9-DG protein
MHYKGPFILKRRAFTLVELLVVIAIIAVLLAVLMPALTSAKSLAQRMICRSRLKSIGLSVVTYSEQYDGRLMRADRKDAQGVERLKNEYWTLAMLKDAAIGTQYYGLGCLWKSGLVSDGKLFYCPGVRNWLDEYKHYCNPMPWGTLPQVYNSTEYPSGNQYLRAYKGYLFWPQTRKLVTTAEIATYPVTGERYAAGFPSTPYLYTDMAPNRSISLDCSPHTVKGTGLNANVLYGDGHVNQNLWPQDPVTKRYYFPNPADDAGWDIFPNLDSPYNDVATYWREIKVCEYMVQHRP